MKYYFAGYYLIRLNPLDHGDSSPKSIYSCSTCINDSLLDSFSRSWISNSNYLQQAKDNFKIDSTKINQIQEWTKEKDSEDKIGYQNVFSDIDSVKEYRDNFFAYLDHVKIFALYLPNSESKALIDEFEAKKDNQGEIGIVHILKKKKCATDDQHIIGYDLIGVESSGEFHTFHCHNLSYDLNKQFGVKLNEYSLLENDLKWQEIVDYMNDETNGFESVPWFFAQIRLID